MNEIIQIKCPFDGAVLSVRNQPGIESKNVTCPICKHRYPFTEFKRVQKSYNDSGDSDTAYPDGTDDRDDDTYHGYGHKSEITELGRMNFVIGRLRIPVSGVMFQLQPGRNVIGRKGQKSQANFQIDTGDKRSMSREHIVIDVKKVHLKGFVHYLSLYKEKVNPTFIGNDPLLYGDCIVLAHGDVIKLPDMNLKFEIPDDDLSDI